MLFPCSHNYVTPLTRHRAHIERVRNLAKHLAAKEGIEDTEVGLVSLQLRLSDIDVFTCRSSSLQHFCTISMTGSTAVVKPLESRKQEHSFPVKSVSFQAYLVVSKRRHHSGTSDSPSQGYPQDKVATVCNIIERVRPPKTLINCRCFHFFYYYFLFIFGCF